MSVSISAFPNLHRPRRGTITYIQKHMRRVLISQACTAVGLPMQSAHQKDCSCPNAQSDQCISFNHHDSEWILRWRFAHTYDGGVCSHGRTHLYRALVGSLGKKSRLVLIECFGNPWLRNYWLTVRDRVRFCSSEDFHMPSISAAGIDDIYFDEELRAWVTHDFIWRQLQCNAHNPVRYLRSGSKQGPSRHIIMPWPWFRGLVRLMAKNRPIYVTSESCHLDRNSGRKTRL